VEGKSGNQKEKRNRGRPLTINQGKVVELKGAHGSNVRNISTNQEVEDGKRGGEERLRNWFERGNVDWGTTNDKTTGTLGVATKSTDKKRGARKALESLFKKTERGTKR